MKKILILMLFVTSIVYSQKKDSIYRIEGNTKDAVGYSYFVNVLILSEDNFYTLIEQEYVSKKFAKQNIPSKFIKTQGTYTVTNGKIKLDDNGKETIFVIVDDKRIDKLFNNQDRTNFYWKKVRN